MATPFTAEEQLVRRSLFGSLFNVAANKLNKPSQQPTVHYRVVQDNFEECQQPCSSSSLNFPTIQTNNEHYHKHHFRVYVDPETYFQNNNPTISASPSIISQQGSPSNILGQQMDKLELNFNLQQNNETINNYNNNQIKHQDEIYQEIVSECRALEQQNITQNNNGEKQQREITNNNFNQKESSIINVEELNPTSIQPLYTTLTNLVYSSNYLNYPKQQQLLPVNSPQQQQKQQQQQIINNLNNNNNFVGLSLEHLVKVLVQTVREVTYGNSSNILINNNNIIKERNEQEEEEIINFDETAEQILERRRKQNNAAAARYRRRQRKTESLMQKELSALERRNYELRTSIANIKAEIDAENALLKILKN